MQHSAMAVMYLNTVDVRTPNPTGNIFYPSCYQGHVCSRSAGPHIAHTTDEFNLTEDHHIQQRAVSHNLTLQGIVIKSSWGLKCVI